MKQKPISVAARVWLYKGDGPWHFVTIPSDVAKEITVEYPWPRRGFGSIPVNVTVGKTTWKTSVFPDGDTYLLPLKKDVRQKEKIMTGDTITCSICVIS